MRLPAPFYMSTKDFEKRCCLYIINGILAQSWRKLTLNLECYWIPPYKRVYCLIDSWITFSTQFLRCFASPHAACNYHLDYTTLPFTRRTYFRIRCQPFPPDCRAKYQPSILHLGGHESRAWSQRFHQESCCRVGQLLEHQCMHVLDGIMRESSEYT